MKSGRSPSVPLGDILWKSVRNVRGWDVVERIFQIGAVFGTKPAAGEAQNECGKAAELSGRLDGQK